MKKEEPVSARNLYGACEFRALARPSRIRVASFLLLCVGLSGALCCKKKALHAPKPLPSRPNPELKVQERRLERPRIRVQSLAKVKQLLRDKLSRIETYERADPQAYRRFTELLEKSIFRGSTTAVQSASQPVALEEIQVQEPPLRWMSLSEQGPSRTGLPQLLWRVPPDHAPAKAPEGGWILQAPHRFFDRRTGELALALFADPDPRNAEVLFLNTKHRYAKENGSKKKEAHNPSDVCHNEEHDFSRVTRKVMDMMDSHSIVQLHGFGTHKGSRGDALVIVSSGSATAASQSSIELVARLQAHFGTRVLLFPRDTSKLGATTNVQGKISREYAARDGIRSESGFLHIEMSPGMRNRLIAEPADRRKFLDALLAVMSKRTRATKK